MPEIIAPLAALAQAAVGPVLKDAAAKLTADYGLVGVLLLVFFIAFAVVLWFTRSIVLRQFDSHAEEKAWFRAELQRQDGEHSKDRKLDQAQFVGALQLEREASRAEREAMIATVTDVTSRSEAAIERSEKRWAHAVQSLCARIERVEERLDTGHREAGPAGGRSS